ncbi:MAG: response regulator [Lachnospiraceae bacterium]|nr:response regulator [Lachnospiraceae bacterium]
MEDDTRIGTLYSLSDDSEHYRYMDQLREQKQIADNANEAKSQFLANMSHEIRTPINAVLGFNEMVSRECEKVRDAKEEKSPSVSEAFENISMYSENIEGAGNNLLSIINDILDLSKIEVLRNIRAQQDGPNPDTPVICMTADAIIGSREKYIGAGFDDYLSKPVKSEELEQTLIRFLPKEKIKCPKCLLTSYADITQNHVRSAFCNPSRLAP